MGLNSNYLYFLLSSTIHSETDPIPLYVFCMRMKRSHRENKSFLKHSITNLIGLAPLWKEKERKKLKELRRIEDGAVEWSGR